MYLDEIMKIGNDLKKRSWKNLKTGKSYQVIDVAYDATNSREGNPVVVYRKSGYGFGIFVRDLSEFKLKFQAI